MHKTDLAKKIAQKTDLDEDGALTLLNLVISEITASLKKGQKVVLTGFGSFVIRKRKKKTIHNIDTNAPFTVPAHKAVGFEVGETLKRAIRK